MHDQQRFASVVTHMGRRKDIVEMPWLESEYRILQPNKARLLFQVANAE